MNVRETGAWFHTKGRWIACLAVIGVLNSAEGIEPTFILKYRETRPGRIFRNIGYGPLLDVFFVDLRSYRGANQGEGGGDDQGREHQADDEHRQLIAWLAARKDITRTRTGNVAHGSRSLTSA